MALHEEGGAGGFAVAVVVGSVVAAVVDSEVGNLLTLLPWQPMHHQVEVFVEAERERITTVFCYVSINSS